MASRRFQVKLPKPQGNQTHFILLRLKTTLTLCRLAARCHLIGHNLPAYLLRTAYFLRTLHFYPMFMRVKLSATAFATARCEQSIAAKGRQIELMHAAHFSAPRFSLIKVGTYSNVYKLARRLFKRRLCSSSASAARAILRKKVFVHFGRGNRAREHCGTRDFF